MTKIDLSICLPAFRVKDWERYLDSIVPSLGPKYSVEVIFCGPEKELPEHLQSKYPFDVTMIQDFGNPTRCLQLACLSAKGERLCYTSSDDGWFPNGRLEQMMDMTIQKGIMINGAFREGKKNGLSRKDDCSELEVFYCKYHGNYYQSDFIDPKMMLLFTNIIKTEEFMELGGVDANFETTGQSIVDFGMRYQRAGKPFEYIFEYFFEQDWLPDDTGDHGPVWHAAFLDLEKMTAMNHDPSIVNRIKIPLDNWKNTEDRWHRRFGKIVEIKDKNEEAPTLSVCIPAIRTHLWERFYNSIGPSVGKYSFEVILCGPEKELPEHLKNRKNLFHIQDFGCPTRAHQLACIAARGKYIVWGGDDGWFLPGKLEKALDLLEASKKVNKALVSVYKEGVNNGLGDGNDMSIYTCNHHAPLKSKYHDDKWLIFNSAIVQTSDWKRLGGFDCRLQVPASSIAEYGIRSQRDHCHVIMLNETTFECDWLLGDAGDHGPIHHSQLEEDIPLLNTILNDPTCIERTKIDIGNWGASPKIWEKRFIDVEKQLRRKSLQHGEISTLLKRLMSMNLEPKLEERLNIETSRMLYFTKVLGTYTYLKNLTEKEPDESSILNDEVALFLENFKKSLLQ